MIRCICGLLALCLFPGIVLADDGCSKDTDCKGERICVQRTCVEPQVALPASATLSPEPFGLRPPPAPPDASRALQPLDTPRPQQPLDTRIHRHFGFYFRPELGLGYMSTSEQASVGKVTFSGAAGIAGLALGGALSENVVLAAHLYDVVISDPNVAIEGGPSSKANGTTLALFAIGPQLTIYSMPQNLYFSLTAALSSMRADGGGQRVDSDTGFSARLSVGREWWASDHWGMGFAAHVLYANVPDKGSASAKLETASVFATFSATYN